MQSVLFLKHTDDCVPYLKLQFGFNDYHKPVFKAKLPLLLTLPLAQRAISEVQMGGVRKKLER